MFRVAELVEEESWLEAEGLPAVPSEAIYLPLGVSEHYVIIEPTVLGGWLQKRVIVIQLSQEANESQVALEIRDGFDEDVSHDKVAVLVLSDNQALLFENLGFGSVEVVLKERIVVVLENLWHESSHVLALDLFVAVTQEFQNFEIGVRDVSDVPRRHSDGDDDRSCVVAEELVLIHVIELVHSVGTLEIGSDLR